MKSIRESLAIEMMEQKGSSWTNNEEFDQNGALLLKNVVDGSLLVRPQPDTDEVTRYQKRLVTKRPASEAQVEGSIETYNYPDYKYS